MTKKHDDNEKPCFELIIKDNEIIIEKYTNDTGYTFILSSHVSPQGVLFEVIEEGEEGAYFMFDDEKDAKQMFELIKKSLV